MTTRADAPATTAGIPSSERLHALDALRGFALICGVVLHAAMSYLPGFDVWPLLDRSPRFAAHRSAGGLDHGRAATPTEARTRARRRAATIPVDFTSPARQRSGVVAVIRVPERSSKRIDRIRDRCRVRTSDTEHNRRRDDRGGDARDENGHDDQESGRFERDHASPPGKDESRLELRAAGANATVRPVAG